MKNEERVLEVLRKQFEGCLGDTFADDGAALPAPPDGFERVVTADVVVEHVHFSFALSPPASAGYRAILQNVSDLAAMAATPVGFVWTLAIPARHIDDEGLSATLLQFLEGAAAAARQDHLKLYGGDLSSTKGPLTCSVTAFGDAPAARPLRGGASAGDRIFVGRTLGASAAGLRQLLESPSHRPPEGPLLCAHERPLAQVALGHAVGKLATALMDVSDGLSLDLHRMLAASGVGARLRPDWQRCVSPGATAADALFGGEDYALLMTLPSSIDDATIASLSDSAGHGGELIEIGTIEADVVGVVTHDGEPIENRGYDHFQSGTAVQDRGG